MRKTNHAAETIRKSSSKFFSLLGRAGKAVQQSEMNKQATKQLGKLAENVKHRVDEAVHNMNSPSTNLLAGQQQNYVSGEKEFEKIMDEAEKAATDAATDTVNEEADKKAPALTPEPLVKSETDGDASRPSLYVSEASTAGDEEGAQPASVLRV